METALAELQSNLSCVASHTAHCLGHCRGVQWQAETMRILSETPADMLTDRTQWMDDLRKYEAGEDVSPYSARPMNLTILALKRPEPLAALAFRTESIYPNSTLINGWRSEASLFRRYEVEGPAPLQSGKLDLAFIVVVLLPLFLLILSFDVISQERAAGRLSLILVQGGTINALTWARIVAVAIPLCLVCCLGVVFAGIWFDAAIVDVIYWLAGIAIYTVFWASVAAWLAVRFTSPDMGALAVLASWSMLVVLIPSFSQFAAQAIYPMPSRVTYLSESRDAEAESRLNVTQRAEMFMAEHPGQGRVSDDAVPGFYRTTYLSNLDINLATRKVSSGFERQQEAQRELVSFTRLFSLATSIDQAFQQASGTGPIRAAEFRNEARHHLRDLPEIIGPATVSRARLISQEAEAIPEFELSDRKFTSVAWMRICWILLLAVPITIFATYLARKGPQV